MQTDMIIKMNFTAWDMQNKRFSELVEKLTDEELSNETAPGKNTGIYLLGHITAVTDDMIRLLGLGVNMFPEYIDMFIKSSDKSGQSFPSIVELKSAYHIVTNELNGHFIKFSTEDWLSKHIAVSDEDFVRQPTRNRLNVLISRTIHISYHLGQMAYLKK